MLLRAVDCQREPKVGDKVNFDVEPVKLDTGQLFVDIEDQQERR